MEYFEYIIFFIMIVIFGRFLWPSIGKRTSNNGLQNLSVEENEFEDSINEKNLWFQWGKVLLIVIMTLAVLIVMLKSNSAGEGILAWCVNFIIQLMRWIFWLIALFFIWGELLLWHQNLKLLEDHSLAKIWRVLKLRRKG